MEMRLASIIDAYLKSLLSPPLSRPPLLILLILEDIFLTNPCTWPPLLPDSVATRAPDVETVFTGWVELVLGGGGGGAVLVTLLLPPEYFKDGDDTVF